MWPFNLMKKVAEEEHDHSVKQMVVDLEIERNKRLRTEASKKISNVVAAVAQEVSHVER